MNWGNIKTAVKSYLENKEVTFVNNLPLIARLAEADIFRKVQLKAAQKLATASMILNDRFVTPPPGALSIYSLSIRVGSQDVFLLLKDFAYLKEVYPNPAAYGQPRFYAWRDETALMVAPTPDQTYAMECHHFVQPASIGSGDDTVTTWLSENAENALIFGIIYHGYIYEKGDQEVVAQYKGEFDTAIADLKLIAEGRQTRDNYRTPQ